MASSTTPIPPMRADWTASGACTSGSTAHPRGATRRASGGAATTSTTRAERSPGCRRATAGLEISRRMASERASQQAFFGVSALLFAASAAVTIVWCVFGMAAFPLGVALPAIELQHPALARAVPIAVVVVVLIAGSLQLTAWKARHLACCREAPGRGRTLPAGAGTAWRHGLRLGLHCSHCCAGLMAILLVIGVMDLRAMAVVAAAITVQRLAPARERVARATGAVVVGAGLFLIARAAGLG